MLRDARTVTPGEDLTADLCIVGAGVAGLALALRLRGRGHRIVVLESGGQGLEPDAQELVKGSSTGYSYYRHEDARARGIGGSSLLWPLDEGWRARPLDAVDFEVRPGIPDSGWPFGAEALADYWAPAAEVCDLGPDRWAVDDWEEPHARRLALDPQTVQTSIFQLGTTDFSRHSDAVAAAADITLVTHATVTDLVQSADSSAVDHVEVADGAGRRFHVRATCVVLAAGGIDNARLLLSSTGRSPAGIGNGRDLVGRYFMERLSTRSGVVVPDDPELVPRAMLYSVHHVRGQRVEGVLRVVDEVIVREQLLNCAFFLLARDRTFTSEAVRSVATLMKGLRRRPLPEGVPGHLRNIARHAPDLVRAATHPLRRGNGWDGSVLVVRPQAEQAPNRDSRITLSDRTDRFGMRLPSLGWRLSDLDRRSIRRHQQIIDRELQAAGLGRLLAPLGDEDPPALFEGNKHHMGTTRMHGDPARGVVDADGRVHGVPNLFVTGSSVFPTAGCSNPTLTIAALALRLADHLDDELSAIVHLPDTAPRIADTERLMPPHVVGRDRGAASSPYP